MEPRLARRLRSGSANAGGRSRAVLVFAALLGAYGKRVVLKNATCRSRRRDKRDPRSVGLRQIDAAARVSIDPRTLPEAHLQSGTVTFHGSDIHASGISAVVNTAARRLDSITRPVPFPMRSLTMCCSAPAIMAFLDGAPPEEYARRYLEQVGLWSEVQDGCASAPIGFRRAAAASLSRAHPCQSA